MLNDIRDIVTLVTYRQKPQKLNLFYYSNARKFACLAIFLYLCMSLCIALKR